MWKQTSQVLHENMLIASHKLFPWSSLRCDRNDASQLEVIGILFAEQETQPAEKHRW